jgi:S-adenosylmethionine:tRNA-ribosyltransferase-isomerase (queuine synthetase)
MNRNSVAAKTAGLPYVWVVQKDLEDREAMKAAFIEDYEMHVAADGFQVLSLVLERKPASEHHRGGEAAAQANEFGWNFEVGRFGLGR